MQLRASVRVYLECDPVERRRNKEAVQSLNKAMSLFPLRAEARSDGMALKAALYSALRARKMTVADLARRLDIDDRKAARLIDPRAVSTLTSLEEALSALGYTIAIEVQEKPAA